MTAASSPSTSTAGRSQERIRIERLDRGDRRGPVLAGTRLGWQEVAGETCQHDVQAGIPLAGLFEDAARHPMVGGHEEGDSVARSRAH
jgi:hypothetical protein